VKTKLTLRLDDEIVRRAKRYANEHDTSLSRMVEAYFDAIGRSSSSGTEARSPRVRRLLGALEGAEVQEEDYREHLERKHA
jgi:predicted transcriptional regulator